MDYLWALTFLLGSFYLSLEKKPLYAGILLGIAVSFRITSLVMILPLAVLWRAPLKSPGKLKNLFLFAAPAIAISSLTYIPIFIRFKFFSMRFMGPHTGFWDSLKRATVEAWGEIGVIGLFLLTLFLLFWKKKRPVITAEGSGRILIVCGLTILVYILLFAKFPLEAGYLIPMIPFVLIIAGIILPGRFVIPLCIALICSPFLSLKPGKSLFQGMMIGDFQGRRLKLQQTQRIIRKIQKLPPRSILVCGDMYPVLFMATTGDQHKEFRMIDILKSAAKIDDYLKKGWRIFYLPGLNQVHKKGLAVRCHPHRSVANPAGSGGELVVAVPVYMGRVPALLNEWLNAIQAHNTPTVCVVVYGNRVFDNALLELKNIVMNCGCIPIAWAAYIGEHSFSNSEAPIAQGRPDEDDLNHAEVFGQKICEKLQSISLISQISDVYVPGTYPYGGVTKLWDVDFKPI